MVGVRGFALVGLAPPASIWGCLLECVLLQRGCLRTATRFSSFSFLPRSRNERPAFPANVMPAVTCSALLAGWLAGWLACFGWLAGWG
ncbi:hypothetical protein IWX49DRAFT_198963 [Phyllosticta citricarpa]